MKKIIIYILIFLISYYPILPSIDHIIKAYAAPADDASEGRGLANGLLGQQMGSFKTDPEAMEDEVYYHDKAQEPVNQQKITNKKDTVYSIDTIDRSNDFTQDINNAYAPAMNSSTGTYTNVDEYLDYATPEAYQTINNSIIGIDGATGTINRTDTLNQAHARETYEALINFTTTDNPESLIGDCSASQIVSAPASEETSYSVTRDTCTAELLAPIYYCRRTKNIIGSINFSTNTYYHFYGPWTVYEGSQDGNDYYSKKTVPYEHINYNQNPSCNAECGPCGYWEITQLTDPGQVRPWVARTDQWTWPATYMATDSMYVRTFNNVISNPREVTINVTHGNYFPQYTPGNRYNTCTEVDETPVLYNLDGSVVTRTFGGPNTTDLQNGSFRQRGHDANMVDYSNESTRSLTVPDIYANNGSNVIKPATTVPSNYFAHALSPDSTIQVSLNCTTNCAYITDPVTQGHDCEDTCTVSFLETRVGQIIYEYPFTYRPFFFRENITDSCAPEIDGTCEQAERYICTNYMENGWPVTVNGTTYTITEDSVLASQFMSSIPIPNDFEEETDFSEPGLGKLLCSEYEVQYVCPNAAPVNSVSGECAEYESNPDCVLVSEMDGERTYECTLGEFISQIPAQEVTVYDCSDVSIACMGTECIPYDEEQNHAFGKTVAELKAANEIADEMANLNSDDPAEARVFRGNVFRCYNHYMPTSNNCCALYLTPVTVALQEYISAMHGADTINQKITQSEMYQNIATETEQFTAPVTEYVSSTYGEVANSLNSAWTEVTNPIKSFYAEMTGESYDSVTTAAGSVDWPSTTDIVSETAAYISEQFYQYAGELVANTLGEELAGMVFETVAGETMQYVGMQSVENIATNLAGEAAGQVAGYLASAVSFIGMAYAIYSIGKMVAEKMVECKDDELKLSLQRQMGQCTPTPVQERIEWEVILGMDYKRYHEKYWCCYENIFSRIVNIQGGAQIGKSPDSNCEGFTMDEIALIDFGAIDFSEWINAIQGEAFSQADEVYDEDEYHQTNTETINEKVDYIKDQIEERKNEITD